MALPVDALGPVDVLGVASVAAFEVGAAFGVAEVVEVQIVVAQIVAMLWVQPLHAVRPTFADDTFVAGLIAVGLFAVFVALEAFAGLVLFEDVLAAVVFAV